MYHKCRRGDRFDCQNYTRGPVVEEEEEEGEDVDEGSWWICLVVTWPFTSISIAVLCCLLLFSGHCLFWLLGFCFPFNRMHRSPFPLSPPSDPSRLSQLMAPACSRKCLDLSELSRLPQLMALACSRKCLDFPEKVLPFGRGSDETMPRLVLSMNGGL